MTGRPPDQARQPPQRNALLSPPRHARLEAEDNAPRQIVVTDIEAFHTAQQACEAGESVGLLLRGVRRRELSRGQVLAWPGSVAPHRVGEAELLVLAPEEGGRQKPFADGYQPQFYFGSTGVTGRLHTGGPVHPGARVAVGFTLQRPVGLEPGMPLALREGGRTVGAGMVTAVSG